MSFHFQETFEVTIPNVEEQLANFAEADFSAKHGLIVEFAAIHEGTTGNYTHYSAKELEKAVRSWLEPYPKPIILHHDQTSEPIGRVVGAKMDQEADGTPFIRLQTAITDPAAIEKFQDKRYLTGSVGGKADEALCSICSTNWAAPKESRGAPCAHRRGKSYRGQIATIEMRDISFKEYSIVNTPADSRSGVREIGTQLQENEEWAKPARFFVLDLGTESIVEYTESEDVDVLGEMKKKDASPMYREMKGAFLEAQIVNKIEEDGVKRRLNDTKDTEGITESDSEETDMAVEENAEVENDDILAVTEQLSEDLSASDEAPQEPEQPEESEEPAEAEESDDTEEISKDTGEAEEGERPQGQEKAHGKDVDPEGSDDVPKSRESEEEAEEPVAAEESEESEEEATAQEGEDAGEQAPESELEEQEAAESEEDQNAPVEESQEDETVEPEEGELQSRIKTLEEENDRLKKALHRVLAERVVDAKIHVGMVAAENRNDEVAAHAERSASSLADSLKDLATMSPVTSQKTLGELEMDQESQIVEGEENVTTIGDEEDSVVETDDPEEVLERNFVDALMGRRQNQL